MAAHKTNSTHPPLHGTVLITGASSGIGRELARRIAPEARQLILVARRTQRLEELAQELTRATGVEVMVMPCDLADANAVERLLTDLETRDVVVDVLVNNAGFGDRAFVEQADHDKLRRMVEVNVLALGRLCHALVPPMVERGSGGVLNISSVLGLIYQPGVATYAGTKHFVTGYTRALRAELDGTGVVVTQVCPGPVATEFSEVAANRTLVRSPDFMRIDASECARAALRGFRRGRAAVHPGRANQALIVLLACMPQVVVRWIMARSARRARAQL